MKQVGSVMRLAGRTGGLSKSPLGTVKEEEEPPTKVVSTLRRFPNNI